MMRILLSIGVALMATFSAAANDFVTNQNADLVLGHSSFTDNASMVVTAATMDQPVAVAVDPTSGKVFVSEAFANRILRFASSSSLVNGEAAEVVIGQPNFSSQSANQGLTVPAANTLASPAGLFVDANGTLWVADSGNHRVLTYDRASTLLPVTNAFADTVLGQTDFSTKTSGNASNKFNTPYGVFVSAADTLYVSDFSNNRVMGYKLISQNNVVNPPASFVVGQAAYGTSTGGFGANQLNLPMAAFVDAGDHLWVADRGNSRVLRFDHAGSLPATNASANGALGRPNTTSQGASLTATGLHSPQGLAMDGAGSLYVADNYDNRVMIYKNAAAKANGAAAEIVLGHPNFTTALAGPTQRTLPGAAGIAFDPQGRLFVVNSAPDRVVRFTKPSSGSHTAPTVTISGKKKVTTPAAAIKIKGTASTSNGSVALVDVQTGGRTKAAKGTTAWSYNAKLKPGKNVFTVRAHGSNGLVSAGVKITITRE